MPPYTLFSLSGLPLKTDSSIQANLQTLFDSAKAAVRTFISGVTLESAAATAFGEHVSGATVAAAIHGFDRDGWPLLMLDDAQALHGARAAYDRIGNTIHVSREFLTAYANAPAVVVNVLVEEIGHAIDAQVNGIDAAGDEGAIFAQWVAGDAPDAQALSVLQAENDHGSVSIGGASFAVEFAAPVVGSVTLDGSLSDWAAGDQIDRFSSVAGYDIYAKATGGSYVFALKAPVAIGAGTTAWFNTDQNVATGYKIYGEAGGAEFNVNFDSTGTPFLYTGNAGATRVSGASVSFGYSADRTVVEFAVPNTAIGSSRVVGTLWDVNNNDAAVLPGDYWGPQYDVIDASGLPARTDFSKKIGIVYSETSANKYFDKMAYSQLFMAAQNQAAMAGVEYEILTESDLTTLSKLVNFDALLFPNFTYVQSSQIGAIETNLKLAVEHYKIGLIASGDFMTNNQSGASLPVDPYERMETLFDVQPVGGGWPADVTVTANNAHPVMQDYAPSELIHSYDDVGWLAYEATEAATGATVLATQTVGGQTYDAVIATTAGGRNVHFSTDEVMADNNLLWQAIDYAVNGSGVTAGLQLSRNTSIVAARNDMDQAQERLDVDPENGGPGIYDKLIPIVQQWKADYNFVGSYYIDIGENPPDQQTVWSQSGAYYRQLLQMGNELGSHSISHPHDTNTLTAAQIQHEFQGSKQIIEQQMSLILGEPFTVDGAAVPGASENLATALSIIQYYDYLSGGFSGVGAGYAGAFGYLTPAMAAQDKVYLAPNVQFDFTLVEFKGMTPAQASAEWQREWNELTSHADVPILVWPWHDYAGTAWSANPPAASPYTTAMFTDFISRAYTAGAEFVTLSDLADRISAFNDSSVAFSVSGNTITASVVSPDAGRFALDLDNLGSQRIARVDNWYAYDNDSVFLPRSGGSYNITLGAAALDVTHITSLPMRSELISLSGTGTNLSFSVFGEGKVVVDLVDPAGRTPTVTGAVVTSLVGDKLTLDLAAIGRHDVSITLALPYVWSSLAHGQTISPFSAGSDVLQFDAGISAAAVSVQASGSNTLFSYLGKTVTVGTALASLTTGNVTFADGSRLVVGENTTGVAGDDSGHALAGGPGNDQLQGLGGNDTLAGGAGGDRLDGGAGIDYAIYVGAPGAVLASLAAPAQNSGDAAGDSYVSVEGLIGSSFNDTLVGDNGVNDLQGRDGNDYLQAGGGNDTLAGGSGDDQLEGGAGADVLDGGAGFNYARYYYSTAGVTADLANAAVNTADAAGDTYISIQGLFGSRFADDILSGDNNSNDLLGFGGNDLLRGRGGNDTLHGLDGNDTLDGGAGADSLKGGSGTDHASYASATGAVFAHLGSPSQNTGDASGDAYLSIEGLIGSAFDDTLVGDAGVDDLQGRDGNDYLQGAQGDDTLRGGNGNDQLEGGAGADVLDGGAGFNYARYYYSTTGVTADLASAAANTGDAAGDTYISVQGLFGSRFSSDVLNGDHHSNDLLGFGGNDTLRGRGGNDTLQGLDGIDMLDGGAGADVLSGGAGNDTFAFVAGQAHRDTLTDFAGNGALAGDRLVFQGYGTAAQGASVTVINAGTWSINSFDGATHDTLYVSNAATLHVSDYSFI